MGHLICIQTVAFRQQRRNAKIAILYLLDEKEKKGTTSQSMCFRAGINFQITTREIGYCTSSTAECTSKCFISSFMLGPVSCAQMVEVVSDHALQDVTTPKLCAIQCATNGAHAIQPVLPLYRYCTFVSPEVYCDVMYTSICMDGGGFCTYFGSTLSYYYYY